MFDENDASNRCKGRVSSISDCFVRRLLVHAAAGGYLFLEEKGNAPKSCNPNQGIDNAADDRHLASKQCCDEIEAKEADTAPVQSTDDYKHQRNIVYRTGHTDPTPSL